MWLKPRWSLNLAVFVRYCQKLLDLHRCSVIALMNKTLVGLLLIVCCIIGEKGTVEFRLFYGQCPGDRAESRQFELYMIIEPL